MIRAATLLVLLVAALARPVLADTGMPREARIGVLAFRGPDRAVDRWTPTAAYLDGAVPGWHFTIVPLTLAELDAAVAEGSVDLVLTNPGDYVVLEARHGISRIATLRSPLGVAAGNLFGAVIFARADRDDLNTLADLKGKTFMGVEREGFGGFQMAWRALKDAGVDPFTDVAALHFSGFPQDRVARAVLDGTVDAGTFRTDTLENLAMEGRLKLSDFKVLGGRQHPGFPFLVSTRLYPEWPFATARHTDPVLAQRVAIALLSMPADHPAARAGRNRGWTVPLDYQPVHDLFRDLGLGPYAGAHEVTLADVMAQWGHWVVLATFVLALAVAWVVRIESVVARRTRELSDANAALERQNLERRRAEDRARRRQEELAHVHRLSTLGGVATGLAHELNQPLSAIANYASGGLRRLGGGTLDAAAQRDLLERIAAQAGRAGDVIRRIRDLVRKQEPVRAPLAVNDLVIETLDLLDGECRQRGVRLDLDLDTGLPAPPADRVRIQQVLINLIRNALEAMAEAPPDRRRLGLTSRATATDLRITVADTGPGLPADDPAGERLMTAFTTTKDDGLGLGLSISRTIVEDHGGRLTADTPPPDGSGALPGARFHVILPLAPNDRTQDRAP
ncbi:MAG: PhnD/SsuA/transferrin family substrate-binding protein [Rhodobacterales bacterium]|nr:PhnD/SsuA/transferrin family substrate-binding protein [Rhodobacterales bacterium]